MSLLRHSRPAISADALVAKLLLCAALALTALLFWVPLAAAVPPPVSFAGAQLFATDNYPGALAAGDFNGDGKADLVTANGPNDVSVLLNDGKGGFAPHVDYAAGTFPVAVAVGDFNGDGKADLVTASDWDGTVSILLGDGSGGFSAPVELRRRAVPRLRSPSATSTGTARPTW